MVHYELQYQRHLPPESLSEFVKCFWYLDNFTGREHEITFYPDGNFDLLFHQIKDELFFNSLTGLSTKPLKCIIPVTKVTVAVTLKLPAAEYLLKTNISSLLNKGKYLPEEFWDIEPADFSDFNSFIKKVSQKMTELLNPQRDPVRMKLFRLLYASKGSIPVEELAEKTGWSSKKINTFFWDKFGLSLISYCTILKNNPSPKEFDKRENYPLRIPLSTSIASEDGINPSPEKRIISFPGNPLMERFPYYTNDPNNIV